MQACSYNPEFEMRAFSVASIIREEPDFVNLFLKYYLDIGARNIVVVMDQPYDAAHEAASLAGLDRARLDVRYLDADGWRAEIGRDDFNFNFNDKQHHAFDSARERAAADWLFCCDADEYLFDTPQVDEMLRAVPGGLASIAIPPAEAVWGPGDDIRKPLGSTFFRRAFRRKRLWRLVGPRLYGDVYPFFRENMLSHTAGKHFYRRDRAYDHISPHNATIDGALATRPAADLDRRHARLEVAHYDAVGFDRWVEKLRRRVDGENPSTKRHPLRLRQIEEFRAALELFRAGGDDRPLRRLFSAYYRIDAVQFLVLAAAGAAFRRPFPAAFPS